MNLKALVAILSFSLIGAYAYAQEWSENQLKVLHQYHLKTTDHRGFMFTDKESSSLEFDNMKDALIYLFEHKDVMDITKVHVSNWPADLVLSEPVLDIQSLVDLYITYVK